MSIPDSFIILKIPVFTSSHYEDNLCLGSSGTMCNCAREDIFVDFVDFNVIKLLFGAGVFFDAEILGWVDGLGKKKKL